MADIRYVITVDDKGRPKIEGLDKSLRGLGDTASKKTGPSISGLWKQVAGGVLVVEGLRKAISGATGLVKSIFDVGIETENYKVRLEALLGSQEEAAGAMQYFKDVAAKVPFTLQEVIESGTKLTAFGLDMKEWTPALTDLAAVMGLKLPEAAAALGRAYAGGAGAADIFRERGILNIIKDSAKMKSGIDDITKLSLPEFREVMLDTFTDTEGKIAGAADKLSTTWTGVTSMIQDKFYQTKEAIAKSGIFDMVKERLVKFNDKLQEWIDSGKMEEFAQKISDAMENAVKAIEGVAKGIKFVIKLIDLLPGSSKNARAFGKAMRDDIAAGMKMAEDAAKDFKDSLEYAKPPMDEVKDAAVKGGKEWETYQKKIKALDDELKTNKDTITGWFDKAADFLKITKDTSAAVDDEKENLFFENEEIKTKVSELKRVLPQARDFRDVVAETADNLKDEAYGFQTVLPPARDFKDLVERIPEKLNDVTYTARETTRETEKAFDSMFENIAGALGGWVEKMLKGIKAIFDAVSEASSTVSSQVKKDADDAGKAMESAAKTSSAAWFGAVGMIVGAFSAFLKLLDFLDSKRKKWTAEDFAAAEESYKKKIREIYGGEGVEVVFPEGGKRTAEGADVIAAQRGFAGMVHRPTVFLAGERGPEHVTVTPSYSPSFHFGDNRMQINIDGRAVAMAMAPHIAELSRIGAMKFHKNGLVEH